MSSGNPVQTTTTCKARKQHSQAAVCMSHRTDMHLAERSPSCPREGEAREAPTFTPMASTCCWFLFQLFILLSFHKLLLVHYTCTHNGCALPVHTSSQGAVCFGPCHSPTLPSLPSSHPWSLSSVTSLGFSDLVSSTRKIHSHIIVGFIKLKTELHLWNLTPLAHSPLISAGISVPASSFTR